MMPKIQAFTIGPIETNCYLVYDTKTKEAVLIDPAVFEEEILDFIKKYNLKVKFIINTHGHYDHIGGNKDFGYPVLIHQKDKVGLKVHRFLKEDDIIQIKDISFKVIHLPGHTPGSIGLECGNMLFTGDTLFCGGVGRTDLPFSSQRDLEKSLQKLMSYSDDVKIYPGHGPPSTIGHERECNPFFGQ